MSKKTKLMSRILAGLLCVIMIAGIVIPFVNADEFIDGPTAIEINLNDWQNKISTYIYTVKREPGTWDVLYGLPTGDTTSYSRIPDAIQEVGYENTLLEGITFYKISNYQIVLVIDNTYIPRDTTNTYKLRISNGSHYIDTEIKTVFGTPAKYPNGVQMYPQNLTIDATTEGVSVFTPINVFKNRTNATGGVTPTTDEFIASQPDILPNSKGVDFVQYRDFITETETNFGYTWPADVKNTYHAGTFENGVTKNYFYLIKATRDADGTYNVTFTSQPSNTIFTKPIVVNGGDIGYTAEVKLETPSNDINIPTQNEGTLRIPITVNIYRGQIIQEKVPYKIIVTPNASGIKIEDNILVIEPTAIAGSYTIKVLAYTSSDTYGSVKFNLNRIQQNYITINCADSLVIPVTGETSTLLSADVFKDGIYDITEPLTWELGSFYNGVSLVDNKLTITSAAYPMEVAIIARLTNNSSIYTTKKVSLVKADTNLKPESVHISGITNNNWILEYPYGKTLPIGLYALKGGKRIDSIELGVRLEKEIPGMTIKKSSGFNSFEIMANGIYDITNVNLIVYSVNYPEVNSKVTLRITPTLEGAVFTSSQIARGATIDANASLINNSPDVVDAVMVIGVYKDEQLVDSVIHSEKKTKSTSDNSITTFSGSIKLPRDISGITVKIMLMRGSNMADATELLAAPLVLTQN